MSRPAHCLLRVLLASLLLAAGAAHAEGYVESRLVLEEEFGPAVDATAPLPLVFSEEDLRPLHLQTSPELLPESLPIAAQTPPSPLDPARLAAWALRALKILSLLCMAALLLHFVREWLRVMRVRVQRPARALTMEHAAWPTVSLLIPAHGSATCQSRRLDALHSCFFDYPLERLHFIPQFSAGEPEVIAAVARLTQAFPGRVHPLPYSAAPSSLQESLLAAVATSFGSALVVLDEDGLPAQDWLREAVTPLLDPAVGAVLDRCVLDPARGSLAARLARLGGEADALLARPKDALALLLAGKARIRALRRQAVKGLSPEHLPASPDGAGLVLGLTRQGWQTSLLARIRHLAPESAPGLLRAPRLRVHLAWASLRLMLLLLDPRSSRVARAQAGAALLSAAMPLLWLLNLLCALLLYASGSLLQAGLALALGAALSFDPSGQPGPALGLAAGARMAGQRGEIRLLPLASLAFLEQLTHALASALRGAREPAPPASIAEPLEQAA